MIVVAQLLLFYLAFYFLISGLDDLSVDLRVLLGKYFRRRCSHRGRMPGPDELFETPEKRIAIMAPLWQEAGVIQAMVETNLRNVAYRNYSFFLGVYPNDVPTISAARELERRHPNVHVVVNARSGPTSKADCLNHIYRGLEALEQQGGMRYEIVMLHDAEDTLHPASLALVNWYADAFGMVQVPVLPFPIGLGDWIHGVYCDEFAEFLSRDMRLRQDAGAFLPSNGVGTAIRREWLEALREQQAGLLFDPDCLTEDYELGMKLAGAGCRQILLPMTRSYGDLLATREYFPNTYLAATRQRARWISGQCLQSWQRHGWPLNGNSCYWFWRDRKGLWGNPLSLVALVLLLLGAVAGIAPETSSLGPWLWLARSVPGADALYLGCLILAVERIAVRTFLVSRVYGWVFALGVPLRMGLSTVINAHATTSALQRFLRTSASGRRFRWAKTEHAFPGAAAPEPITAMASETADLATSAQNALTASQPVASSVAKARPRSHTAGA